MNSKRPFLRAPLEIQFDITNKCNCKCLHCYSSSSDTNQGDDLSSEEIIKVLGEAKEMSVFKIFLGGGEPLLRHDVLEIIKYGKKIGLEIVLSTNGTLVDRDMAKKLRESGISNIQVSIDGSTNVTHDTFRGLSGCFTKAVSCCKNLQLEGVNFGIGTVLSSLNMNEIPEIIDIAIDVGAASYNLMDLSPAGRGYSFYKKYHIGKDKRKKIISLVKRKEQEHSKINFIYSPFEINCISDVDITSEIDCLSEVSQQFVGCEAGRTLMVIDPVGDVYSCELLRYPELKAGNIKASSIDKIWQESELFKSLRQLEISECANCKYVKVCNSGCLGFSYAFNNKLNSKDPRCPI